MKAEYKELRRNLLVLSMAAAMLFQIVPDNMQTQAAASSRKEGSRKAGDTTAALDGIAPVKTEDAATDLTGSITLTAAQESGLDAMVFTAAEEASEEEAQDPAEEDTQTAEATEETADAEIAAAWNRTGAVNSGTTWDQLDEGLKGGLRHHYAEYGTAGW